MIEYITDSPSSLEPEFIRVWLNDHAAMGQRLVTTYTDHTHASRLPWVVFVFELLSVPDLSFRRALKNVIHEQDEP